MMRRSIVFLAFCIAMTWVGCGKRDTPSLNSTADELARWNEENPAPPDDGSIEEL